MIPYSASQLVSFNDAMYPLPVRSKQIFIFLLERWNRQIPALQAERIMYDMHNKKLGAVFPGK